MFIYCCCRWGLVAAPHDVTGPPVDIAVLMKRKEKEVFSFDNPTGTSVDVNRGGKGKANRLGSGLASAWADGSDVEESLWWVAYASQGRRYLTDISDVHDQALDSDALLISHVDGEHKDPGTWANVGKHNGTPAQRAASELVGEVEGEKLLLQLSKQALGAGKRRAEVAKKCEEFSRRVDQLSNVFQHEALSILQTKLAGANAKMLTAHEIRRRDFAATKIQALIRGSKGRKVASVLKSELRVMLALQNLVNELSRPELRSSGLSLAQIDASLVQRMAALQQTVGGKSSAKAMKSKVSANDKKSLPTAEVALEHHSKHHSIPTVLDAHAHVHPNALPISVEITNNSAPEIHSSRRVSEGSSQEPFHLMLPAVLSPQQSPRDEDFHVGLTGNEYTSPYVDRSENVASSSNSSQRPQIEKDSSPRSGSASVRRMYRNRTKFGSDRTPIPGSQSPERHLSPQAREALTVITPEHAKPSSASAHLSRTQNDAQGDEHESMQRLAYSPREDSASAKKPISADRIRPGSHTKSSSGKFSGKGHGKDSSTGRNSDTRRYSEGGDEPLTELEDSYDGYVSTPSVSHGLADSISSMFGDFTVGGTKISPRPKGAIDFGSSVKGLQFTGSKDPVPHPQFDVPMSHTPTIGPNTGYSTGMFAHTNRLNSRPSSAVALTIPALSSSTLEAMGRTAANVKSGNCETGHLVNNALLASLVHFDKAAALVLLQRIVSACGVERLRVWLEGFSSPPSLSLDHSTESLSSSLTDVSESYRMRAPDLTIKSSAALLSELAFQLGLLEEGDQSTYRCVNLCMLLRLLSGGGVGRIKLAELMMLAEDMWLIGAGSDGLNVSFVLAQARYSLLHEV